MALTLTLLAPGAIRADHVSLRLGTDVWAPYEFVDGDQVSGLATEIVTQVLNDMDTGVTSIFVYPWARAVRLAEAGDIDVLYSGQFIADRQRFLWYPDTPLVESRWVVAVRAADRERFPFRTWEDLKRGRVGVVRGYRYGDGFDRFLKNNIAPQVANENQQNLVMLKNHRVDYVVCDLLNCRYLLDALGLSDKIHIYAETPIALTQYYAMFSRKTVSEDFVRRFDDHLGAFRETPAYDDLIARFVDAQVASLGGSGGGALEPEMNARGRLAAPAYGRLRSPNPSPYPPGHGP
ncbi:substrate-binding periplasmic protein [Roseospira navarrensis]|nr:transporter substrate-binding domain-containing protein [Roseospira navarrensis]